MPYSDEEKKRRHEEQKARWRKTPEGRSFMRNWKLQKYYGLTLEAFNALLAGQGGKCAVCETSEWRGHGPVLDHDHVSGKVRGILCTNCNTAIGLMKDDPKRIAKLFAYLKEGRT
jgi:hypothetical protein